MEDALVSIIIPAYNAEHYIEETIKSILCQTYKQWEMIVVDDGSTDKTADIVKRHSTDVRIKYFFKHNGGVSSARNHGCRQAKGDFIAFFDADDIMHEDNLERKIEVMIQDRALGFVFSDMYHADEHMKNAQPAPRGVDDNIFMDSILFEGKEVVPGISSNIMIRKQCLENKVIRFDTSRLSKNAVFWPNSLPSCSITLECPRLLGLGSDTEVQKVGKADGLFWTA